jgi:hypothetical protein
MKIAMFWNAWTSQITTRILKDALGVQRLARVNRADYVIACDVEAHAKLSAMGISVTEDLTNPDMVRCYMFEEDFSSDVSAALRERLPECDSTEFITVALKPLEVVHSPIDSDPYAGVKFYKDWHTIPETLPLTKKPPQGPPNPMWSPFL